MTSDDAARRERAEKLTEQVASLLHELWSKWFLHQYQNATNENVRRWMAQAGTTYWGLSESDKDKDRKLAQPLVEMILAGACEEAAIWEPELKATINEFIGDAASRHQEIEKLRAEIAALREAVRDLEYANAMFTHENKSFREAIIGMEGGLNIADSWRTHPTVLYVLEGKR